MQYVLITPNKMKLLLSQQENMAVQRAIVNNDKAVFVQGATISLNIVPEIYPVEIWYAQENERLANNGKRLCKKCLSIMNIDDKCTCWTEMSKGDDKNAFKSELPESVKGAVKQIAENKSFPKITELDIEQEKLLSGEFKHKPKMITGEDDDGSWYIDESGEKMYQ